MLYGTTLCFDAARHTFFLLIMSSLCTPMYSCILFYSSRLALLRADVFRFSLSSESVDVELIASGSGL